MSSRGKRIRTIERIKSILIVLLSCSAIYLTLQIHSTVSLRDLLPEVGAPSGPGTSGGDVRSETVLPLRMAATLRSGGEVQRYGVQYDAAESDTLFQQVYSLLIEGLSSASSPTQVTEAQWQKALTTAPGIFIDWQGEIPMPVLQNWLSVENPKLTGTVRRMVLTVSQGQVVLYYSEVDSGRYYVSTADIISQERLTEALSSLKDNGARFAFEQSGYQQLAPYTMLLPQVPTPRVYTAKNPVADGAVEELLLELLGFDLGTSWSYDAAGARVIRHENDTLRIATDGTVTYDGAEGSGRYPVAGPSLSQAAERCRSLAQKTLGSLCGEAKLYLLSVTPTQGGGWHFRFGYDLNGISVRLDQGSAAEFVVEQGQIVHFQMVVRTYQGSDATSVVLPERQAMAAMAALGHQDEELLLVYLDTGAEQVSASWAAASELNAEG